MGSRQNLATGAHTRLPPLAPWEPSPLRQRHPRFVGRTRRILALERARIGLPCLVMSKSVPALTLSTKDGVGMSRGTVKEDETRRTATLKEDKDEGTSEHFQMRREGEMNEQVRGPPGVEEMEGAVLRLLEGGELGAGRPSRRRREGIESLVVAGSRRMKIPFCCHLRSRTGPSPQS